MPRPVALLDANVLYPARLRDLIIRLDLAGLYQARWTEQILDECFDNLADDRPDLSETHLVRTRRLMTIALPGAVVSGYEERVDTYELPDADDRHVLAAAVTAEAAFLVTNNLADFPEDSVPGSLHVVSPDDFVVFLANNDLDAVAEVIEVQAAALVNPPMTTTQLLDGLADVGLAKSVDLLRSVSG